MSEGMGPIKIERAGNGFRFDFTVRAERGESQLKKAAFGAFEILCDEAGAAGGNGSAPPPLAYFGASLAF
jgi:hypothetical protein